MIDILLHALLVPYVQLCKLIGLLGDWITLLHMNFDLVCNGLRSSSTCNM